MIDYCNEMGISLHFTTTHTPQLNGIAERMNRTLVEIARNLLNTSSLSSMCYGDEIITSTYLVNGLPSKAIARNKTPFELWHGEKPEL